MDSGGRHFGAGPRELSGAVDLISHFGLWPYHELFCKNSLPSLISDTPYLRNVVGDTEIRKDNEMKVSQLFEHIIHKKKRSPKIHPFGLAIIGETFQNLERAALKQPHAEREILSSMENLKSELKVEKQHRKRRDRPEESIKDPKKQKSNHKEKDKIVKMSSNRKVTNTRMKTS